MCTRVCDFAGPLSRCLVKITTVSTRSPRCGGWSRSAVNRTINSLSGCRLDLCSGSRHLPSAPSPVISIRHRIRFLLLSPHNNTIESKLLFLFFVAEQLSNPLSHLRLIVFLVVSMFVVFPLHLSGFLLFRTSFLSSLSLFICRSELRLPFFAVSSFFACRVVPICCFYSIVNSVPLYTTDYRGRNESESKGVKTKEEKRKINDRTNKQPKCFKKSKMECMASMTKEQYLWTRSNELWRKRSNIQSVDDACTGMW